MLKNVFLLFVFFSIASFQNGESKILNDYELSDKQFSDWNAIKNNWYATDFEKIKVEQKVAMSCKSCSSFMMDVILTINQNGKLESYKMVSGKKCGVPFNKELEVRMMRNFFKFEFPGSLRGLTFQTKIGDALKC